MTEVLFSAALLLLESQHQPAPEPHSYHLVCAALNEVPLFYCLRPVPPQQLKKQ